MNFNKVLQLLEKEDKEKQVLDYWARNIDIDKIANMTKLSIIDIEKIIKKHNRRGI